MYIFVRHCFLSDNSVGKRRPASFDRRALFRTLQATLRKQDRLFVLLDAAKGKPGEQHFTEADYGYVTRFQGGTDAKSFAQVLQTVQTMFRNDDITQDDVLVFLEDDYAVKQGWQGALEAGLRVADYVTLYDHPDKYTSLYQDLVSKVYKVDTFHFRTTPSTTNSYACTARTLLRDMAVHERSCDSNISSITNDHGKFLQLWSQGRSLVSSIPAFWSHEEEGMQACIQ